MKKITFLFLLIFAIAKTNSQNYLISFAGTGASTTVDSVKVENITQANSLTFPGTDTLHLTGTQGVNNSDLNNENLQIFPNPMQGQTELSFYAKKTGIALLVIYDISGKVVLKISNEFSQGIQRYRITGLKQGIYFIGIIGENYFHNAKLISLNSSQSEAIIEYLGREKPETAIVKLKCTKAIVNIAYAIGDTLRFTGYSDTYTDIVSDIPAGSKTITFVFLPPITHCGIATDVNGNSYNTVQIGAQCWFSENLKTSKYRNNINIPNVLDSATWISLTSGAWCYYNNDTSNNAVYGKLYNWYAAINNNGLCPTGFHVPTDADWSTLTAYLTNNGYGYEGSGSDIAKSMAAISGWTTYLTSGTIGNDQVNNNSSGFSLLSGGFRRDYDGAYTTLGLLGSWWSNTESNLFDAWWRLVSYNSGNADRLSRNKKYGFSVRCVSGDIPALSTDTVTGIGIDTAVCGGDITSDGGFPVTVRGICWSTSPVPTLADSFSTDGSGTGSFISNISGLTASTTYYARAYATNSMGTAYGNEVSFTTASSIINCGTITDIDGNIYNTVLFGTQCWMKENLKTSKFRDGSRISIVTDNLAWNWLSTEAFSWYNNDSANYENSFGKLYNWFSVVDARNLCPDGWHVPSDAEWTNLTDYLTNNGYGYGGSGNDIAKSMTSTTGWTIFTTPGTPGNDQTSNNSSGFTGLPSCERRAEGTFPNISLLGSWWSNTVSNTYEAWSRYLTYNSSTVLRYSRDKNYGYSVRCLRD